MAWFVLLKKKYEKYRITLEDVRNHSLDNDYLIWKYKKHIKRKDYNSVCLFYCIHIPLNPLTLMRKLMK